MFDEPIALPQPPGREDPSAYWSWISLACEAFKRDTPYDAPPAYLSFDSTEEYKEQAEREAVEDECSPRARELVDLMLKGQVSKKRDSAAYFFAAERFEFASRLAKALATQPKHAKPGGVAGSPAAAPIETIRWLAIDLYDAGHFYEKRWSQKSRYDY